MLAATASASANSDHVARPARVTSPPATTTRATNPDADRWSPSRATPPMPASSAPPPRATGYTSEKSLRR